MGKRKFNEFFLSIVLSLLRDENADVKTTFIENFGPIFTVISPGSMIDALEPVLVELAKSSIWRNKKLALEFIVKITEVGGAEVINRESLLKLINDLTKDNFESVRDCVAQTIIRLKEIISEAWVLEKLMPEIEK